MTRTPWSRTLVLFAAVVALALATVPSLNPRFGNIAAGMAFQDDDDDRGERDDDGGRRERDGDGRRDRDDDDAGQGERDDDDDGRGERDDDGIAPPPADPPPPPAAEPPPPAEAPPVAAPAPVDVPPAAAPPPVEAPAGEDPPVAAAPPEVVLQPLPPASAPIVDNDGDATTDGFRSGQAMVRLDAGADVGVFNTRHGTESIAAVPSRDLYLLRFASAGDDASFARLLAADPDARWAELNFVSQAPEGRPSRFFVSGESLPRAAGPTYAPGRLGVAAANDCATGGGVTVAVIDTGIDAGHPDLAGRIGGSIWNALDDGSTVADVGNGQDDDGDGHVDEMTGHGTHVAGIVAQVAPDATILPIKVLDSDGVGDAFYVAAAIYHAIDNGAEVINLSLGSTHDARSVAEAVAEARGAGVVVVAAAGNANRDEPEEYPALDDDVLGVAATDPIDIKSAFSNYHVDLAISAPGTAIVSAFPGGGYVTWSGTSMAAPWVAGAAALLLSANPAWTADDVAQRLAATAVDLDPFNPAFRGQLGAGRLDVAAAGCGTAP